MQGLRQINLISNETIHILQYQPDTPYDDLYDTLNYVIFQMKKIQKQNGLILKDEDQETTIEKIIQNNIVIINVYFPLPTTDKDKYIYTIEGEKISSEKFRNNRKIEKVLISLPTVRSIMVQKLQQEMSSLSLLSNNHDDNISFVAPPLSQDEINKREKVSVQKGGQMAYVLLNRTGSNSKPRGITAKEVSRHNTESDAWTVFDGKVYDITLYNDYHPGGKDKLMQGAGKDCTQLFNQFHSWVNGHAFLEKDCIGYLVKK